MKQTKQLIGNTVKSALRAKKWSYYRLWKESGVKIGVVHSIISGTSNYTIESLLKVEAALGVNLWNVKEPM